METATAKKRSQTEQVGSYLRKCNFTVSTPSTLPGAGGGQHTFDIGATRKDTNLFLDLVCEGTEISVDYVVEFFAKILDTRIQRGFLIAIPKLSDEAQKLSEMYGLSVISAETPKEAVEKLLGTVESPQSVKDARWG